MAGFLPTDANTAAGVDYAPNVLTRSAPRPRRPAGIQPLGGGPRRGLGGLPNGFSGGMSTFSADNNLIGSQILPTDSAHTTQAQGWTTGSGAAYNGGTFKPWQAMGPLDYGTERGMLSGANTQMQGLSYDNTRANGAYGAAQSTLGNAARTATGTMQGLQGLGVGSFSGGGASTADTGELKRGLGKAEGLLGGQFNYEGDTGEARGLTLGALRRAQSAPDRGALAADSLSLLEARSQPGYERALRDVTGKNAAMGRRGSGMTTNDLTDVSTSRERELSLARRDAALGAANLTMQDNTDRTNLAMGVTQGFGGLDTSAAQTRMAQAETMAKLASEGFDAEKFNAMQGEGAAQRASKGAMFGADFQRGVGNDLYGYGKDASTLSMGIGDRYGDQERDRIGLGTKQADFQRGTGNDLGGMTRDTYNAGRDERDAGRRDEYGQDTARRDRLTTNRGYLGERETRDYNDRQEVRGERSWQNDRSNEAMDREYERQRWEESLRNGRYNRGIGTATLGFGANSPTGTYQGAADRSGQDARDSYGAVGNWMQEYGRRRGGAGNGSSRSQRSGGQTYLPPDDRSV